MILLNEAVSKSECTNQCAKNAQDRIEDNLHRNYKQLERLVKEPIESGIEKWKQAAQQQTQSGGLEEKPQG